MATALQLEVVTPTRTVLVTEVESVIIPGADGAFGVLPNHAPLVATMGVGVLKFGQKHAEKEEMAIGGGFVEVATNRVTVLADTAEMAEDIDVARAKAAAERAERRLRHHSAEIDMDRAAFALRKALVRLHVAHRNGRK